MFKTKWFKISLISLSAVLILGALFLTFNFLNPNRVMPGVKIGVLALGGLEKDEAQKRLAEKTADFKDRKIEFRLNEKSWEFSPNEIGAEFENEKTLNEIMAVGRGADFFSGLEQQLGFFLFRDPSSAVFMIDDEKFGRFIEKVSVDESLAEPASFKYDTASKTLTIEPEKNGRIINKRKLADDLNSLFSSLLSSPVRLEMEEDRPAATAQKLETQKKEAEKIISAAPVKLKSPELSWPLDQSQLAEWLTIKEEGQNISLDLDQQKIKDFLSSVASSVNREAQNAKLTWSKDKIAVFSLSQDGQKLNIEQSVRQITEDILSGEKTSTLAVDLLPASITSTGYEELGLKTKIGSGESSFSGSSSNRIHNIKTGTAKLNGLLLEPGQEFSFSEFIGEISGQTGYLTELVIKKNENVLEYGGGVCQISTTLFRAAVNSGLKISERHPHAFPVRYYNPAGFDATVYPPSPDLKFFNDTPGHLLIQGKVSGNKLIFDFFGTRDNRETKVKGPTILESKPDGSMKTILTQEIWRNGQLERADIFRSNYKSPDLFSTPSPSPLPTP